jgi:hypothetical protein
MRAQAGQVDEAVDRALKMVGWNVTLDAELVEQCFLHHRPLAHHHRILLHSGELNQDFRAPATPPFSTESVTNSPRRAAEHTPVRQKKRAVLGKSYPCSGDKRPCFAEKQESCCGVTQAIDFT